jgi:hypothetical protein
MFGVANLTRTPQEGWATRSGSTPRCTALPSVTGGVGVCGPVAFVGMNHAPGANGAAAAQPGGTPTRRVAFPGINGVWFAHDAGANGVAAAQVGKDSLLTGANCVESAQIGKPTRPFTTCSKTFVRRVAFATAKHARGTNGASTAQLGDDNKGIGQELGCNVVVSAHSGNGFGLTSGANGAVAAQVSKSSGFGKGVNGAVSAQVGDRSPEKIKVL